MDKLNQILAQVLGIDENSITEKTSPETVESWDSFNGLMIVSELEQNFKVKFSMEEVLLVKNVGDIRKTLQKHQVQV